jgi:hypothetical protein
MFLYVLVAYADIMRLPNPGYLQEAAGNQDADGGGASNRRHMSNRVRLLFVLQ